MTRWLVMVGTAVMISGCAFPGFKKVDEVAIKKQEVARIPLNLPDPTPLKPHAHEWILITPDNAESVWQRLRDSNSDLVIFGLTDDGYERLALDMAEIRTFIAQLRNILNEYRRYYEPAPEPASK
jgi:hypothetical protein